ncbi:sulfite exporter TauE/SafE family protein [Acidisoma sp. 7E03]
MDLLHGALAIVCGGLVGFTLGLIGGGGSIMATPLLLYVVGLSPHVAIGTGALAVSANAFGNFGGYARQGIVRWQCAILFSIVGVLGAAAGSFLGKQVDGKQLIFLFAILMIVVGLLMLRRRERPSPSMGEQTGGQLCRLWQPAARHQWPLLGTALAVGLLSGFFGIGGGFLIVPGLLFATGMPMICAIGSSLLAVGAFGLTTAISYGASGLVDWTVALEYIAGGVVGGMIGMALTKTLAGRKSALNRIFAGFVFVVAAYMLYRNAAALHI